MKALNKLSLFTIKGIFRDLIKNPGKLILTIFITIIFIASFVISRTSQEFDSNQAIMVSNLGNAYNLSLLTIALMFVSTTNSKGRSLLFPTDAHYLLTGPFTRSQVIRYSLRTSLLSIIIYTLFSLYFFLTMSTAFYKTVSITLIAILGSLLLSTFTVLLSDYVFLLESGENKKKKIAKIIMAILILAISTVIALALFKNNFDFKASITDLGNSNLIFFIPIFGQSKLIFSSFISQDYLLTFSAIIFLIAINSIIYLLIINYRGNINEDLYEASLRYKELLKRNKKGQQNKQIKTYNTKIKTKFSKASKSIFDKNYLIARREKSLFEMRFVFILVIYLVLAKFTFDNNFSLYIIYDIIFLLVVGQNNTLLNDLKNYQIYLIPQSAFKKLFYVVLFPLIQLQILNLISMIAASFLLNASPLTSVSYIIYTASISLLIIGVNTIVTRITKSKTSQLIRMTAQMFLTIIFIAPSAIVLLVIQIMEFNISLLIICLLAALVNILLFLLQIFLSRNIFSNTEID